MNRRQFHLRREHRNITGGIASQLLRWREKAGWLHAGSRQLRWKSARHRLVNVWRVHATASDGRKWERSRAGLHQSRDSPRCRCYLERRNRIEGYAVAKTNHALAIAAEQPLHNTRLKIRTVG